MTTPASVTIDGALYDDLLAALSSTEPRDDREELAGRLAAVIENDWCEDDGSGYCGNHDAYIAYVVDNFGPEGKVIKTWAEDDTGFAVCSSSMRYDADLDR